MTELFKILDPTYGPKSYGTVQRGDRVFLRNYHRVLKNGKGITFATGIAKIIGISLNRSSHVYEEFMKEKGE